MTLGRLFARIPARPLLAAVALALLVGYFVGAIRTFRLPGWWFVLGVGAGLGLFALAVLRAAWCAATLRLPGSLRGVGAHADRFLILLVVNLIIISALSPVPRMLAAVQDSFSISHGVMAAAGALSAQVLLIVFVVGVVGLGWVLPLLVLRDTIGRWALIRALGRGLDWVLVAMLVVFCAAGVAVVLNGAVGAARSVPVRAEVAAITGMELRALGVGLAWVELRGSPAPGLTEQVLVVPEIDDIWPQRVAPGLPVLVESGSGLFGVRWVYSIKIDEATVALRALAAVPTAAALRKWAIDALWRDRKWPELRAHAEAHFRAYPHDREYVLQFVKRLESAGQAAEATALRAAVQP